MRQSDATNAIHGYHFQRQAKIQVRSCLFEVLQNFELSAIALGSFLGHAGWSGG
jgi:hypothetical protein